MLGRHFAVRAPAVYGRRGMGDAMPEHPQVVRTRELLAAFADAELASLGDFFTDDVVWHVGGKYQELRSAGAISEGR